LTEYKGRLPVRLVGICSLSVALMITQLSTVPLLLWGILRDETTRPRGLLLVWPVQ
jgi:hypothetical protein